MEQKMKEKIKQIREVLNKIDKIEYSPDIYILDGKIYIDFNDYFSEEETEEIAKKLGIKKYRRYLYRWDMSDFEDIFLTYIEIEEMEE
jgi:hypothetical protein